MRSSSVCFAAMPKSINRLAEQLEATRNILEAAKKDASKKAEGATQERHRQGNGGGR